VFKKKNITESQHVRMSAYYKHSVSLMRQLLQLFLEMDDKENANRIKKAILSVQVACNRGKKDIRSYRTSNENIDSQS
jgi:hypothetical protein